MSGLLPLELRANLGDDVATLMAPGLGVEFRKVGDRWSDAILCGDRGIVPPCFSTARPATEDPARVASPVYQDLQLHGSDTGRSLCLLLTGLFFKHHFSAAVTLATDPQRAGRILLDYDVADRCRSPVESLAATYLVGFDSGALASADPGRIAWHVAAPTPGLLELVAPPPASLALGEAGRRGTLVQVLASIQPGSFTHRLRYCWRWTSDEESSR
jgi:hypothetical protein